MLLNINDINFIFWNACLSSLLFYSVNVNANSMATILRYRYTLSVVEWAVVELSAKYEFGSSNTTRTTFIDESFVRKLAPLADEPSGFFIENLSRRLTFTVLNVANSYLVYCS
jgi:hypothetical protein